MYEEAKQNGHPRATGPQCPFCYGEWLNVV
ncbi:hypothetical protein ES705_29114 [subsurface metagenome]